jgi:IclR family mhp operon transcriptional activator
MLNNKRSAKRPASDVRSLARGLQILSEVSRSGGVQPGCLSARLGIPRPTVYRLLETMEQLGFVSRSASDSRFRVTAQVRALAAGYDTEHQLFEAAGPVINELSDELVWPIDISIYEEGAMLIQETTHSRSPLSIDRGMIGRRLPVLRTAPGRAYLAFCPEKERAEIINHLRKLEDPEDRPFLDPQDLSSMIDATRAVGYGRRVGEAFIPKTSSIAVPIRIDGGVAACLAVIWITSALTIEEAVARFLDPLRLGADKIADRLK